VNSLTAALMDELKHRWSMCGMAWNKYHRKRNWWAVQRSLRVLMSKEDILSICF